MIWQPILNEEKKKKKNYYYILFYFKWTRENEVSLIQAAYDF